MEESDDMASVLKEQEGDEIINYEDKDVPADEVLIPADIDSETGLSSANMEEFNLTKEEGGKDNDVKTVIAGDGKEVLLKSKKRSQKKTRRKLPDDLEVIGEAHGISEIKKLETSFEEDMNVSVDIGETAETLVEEGEEPRTPKEGDG
jgi:hypothetical protein